MNWKRWRHCWQLFDGDKKIAVVACKRNRDGGSVFDLHVRGKRITPVEYELKWWNASEGAWGSLRRAKRVAELEA